LHSPRSRVAACCNRKSTGIFTDDVSPKDPMKVWKHPERLEDQQQVGSRSSMKTGEDIRDLSRIEGAGFARSTPIPWRCFGEDYLSPSAPFPFFFLPPLIVCCLLFRTKNSHLQLQVTSYRSCEVTCFCLTPSWQLGLSPSRIGQMTMA